MNVKLKRYSIMKEKWLNRRLRADSFLLSFRTRDFPFVLLNVSEFRDNLFPERLYGCNDSLNIERANSTYQSTYIHENPPPHENPPLVFAPSEID